MPEAEALPPIEIKDKPGAGLPPKRSIKSPAGEPLPGVGPVERPERIEGPKARLSTPSGRRAGVRGEIIDDGEGRLEKKEDTVLGGRHWRIKTAQGAVHVWVPADYDRETAGTVVYVHGYYTDADGAWQEHELARQFKASRQNAMFVVPDAPSGNDEHV
jgi:hypothetical protein